MHRESYLTAIAHLHQTQQDLNGTITQLRAQLKEQQLQFEVKLLDHEVLNPVCGVYACN